jgi:hypothetical protein
MFGGFLGFQVFKNVRFHVFRASSFQSFEVFRNQGFVLSRNQGFEVSGFLIQFEVSMNLGFRVEDSRDKFSEYRGFHVPVLGFHRNLELEL